MKRLAVQAFNHYTSIAALLVVVAMSWYHGDWRWAIAVAVVAAIAFEAGRFHERTHADGSCLECRG